MFARECTQGLLAILLLAASVSSLPKPAQDKEAPPNAVEDVTLSTELRPPPLSDDDLPPGYLVIVNLYAVKNSSAETVDDMLENEVFESIAEPKGPIASLLVLLDEDEENQTAVDLKAFADDMTREGFHVQTFEKDGQVRVIIVDLEVMDVDTALNRTTLNKPERLTKVRSRRSACMSCMMGGGGGGKKGGSGGSMGGGCGGGQCGMMMNSGCGGNPCGMMHPSGGGCGGGGCGGGGGGMKTVTIPVYVVPVQVSMGGGGGGHHHMGGGGGGCNRCQGYGGGGGHPYGGGGGGGGYPQGGGGGGSYSQSQASASASSSSYGWGKK